MSLRHEGRQTQKMQREEKPEAQFWLLLLYVFSPPPQPALCKLGQPGGLFASSEVLTLVFRPSFVLFLQAFSFLCLLVTAILDSFFLLYYLILPYTINKTIICSGKQKFICLLYCNTCFIYCGGLEQNPLYLRSLPLYTTLDQEFVSLVNENGVIHFE